MSKRTLLFLLLLLNAAAAVAGDFTLPERRRDQFGTDYSYYVYPIAGDIPGLGAAAGIGGSLINIYGTDTDFTAFKIDGDFSASGYTLLNMHALPRRLIFDVGYYDFNVAPIQYFRGIDSSADDYILPRAAGAYVVGQMTASFDERRYEGYYRILSGKSHLIEVRDKDGNAFAAIDSADYKALFHTLGMAFDFTDDRDDPRRGIRFEASAQLPNNEDKQRSDYFVSNFNFTGYLPLRTRDTLALNVFLSDAYVLREGITDFATLQAQDGLGCAAIPPGPEHDQCVATETVFLNEAIAANRYGIATPLGGTQRLRSYANGRFYAGQSFFWGAEYRWNLTEEYAPFDILVARGIRTGIQLAAFYEQGTVADDWRDLFSNLRTSYGLGFRVLMSGLVVRADYAWGGEGGVFQLFISYPWSMFSVDSPG